MIREIYAPTPRLAGLWIASRFWDGPRSGPYGSRALQHGPRSGPYRYRFRAVAAACPRRRLQPHLIDETASESQGFSDAELRALRRIAALRGPAAIVAQHWLDAELGRLEQEAVDPVAPVARGARPNSSAN